MAREIPSSIDTKKLDESDSDSGYIDNNVIGFTIRVPRNLEKFVKEFNE